MYSAIDNIHFHFLYIDRYSFGKNWIFPLQVFDLLPLFFFEGGETSFQGLALPIPVLNRSKN